MKKILIAAMLCSSCTSAAEDPQERCLQAQDALTEAGAALPAQCVLTGCQVDCVEQFASNWTSVWVRAAYGHEPIPGNPFVMCMDRCN